MKLALRADLLDFVGDPALDDPQSGAVRWRPDHWLLIDADGRILGAQREAPGADFALHDHRGRLLLPGFVDTHVHSAQLDVIGSWGAQLLDWLNTYTFPAERRHADAAHAQAASAQFLDALLAHGTTAAAVFPTVHRGSADALLAAAHARGMRLLAGKVLMDRHAPADLCDDLASAEADSRALIARWHGCGRLAYALTPRFAPTSTPAQLALAGRLLAEHPGTYLQTHLAENPAEVRWVAELFPEARSYLDVYARHGLLGARTVLAHGIWLDAADRARLAEAGAQIAHCPSSNLFLGSGVFDWRAARAAGVAVSLGSDVGGGTSLSMLRTMADAYKVQALAGVHLSAWALLHAATRGAAQALGLAHEIGTLDSGALADVCIWDWAVGPVAAWRDRLAVASPRGAALHERAFAWVTLADERNLVECRVAGRLRHARAAGGTDAAAAPAHST